MLYRTTPLSTKGRRLLVVLIGFLLAACLLGVVINMQRSLVRGNFGGIYWLILGYPKVIFPLLCLAMAYALGQPFLRRRRAAGSRDIDEIVTSALMLAGIPMLLCMAGLPLLLSNFSHIDSASAGGRRYYLAGQHQPLFGTNYLLLECDRAGFYCHHIWLSAPSDYNQVVLTTDEHAASVLVQADRQTLYVHPEKDF